MKSYLPLFIIVFFFGIIYVLGTFTSIPFGDSIGIVLDAEKSEFTLKTYSTSHFLFTNTLVLTAKILPFADAVEICKYFVIVSALIFLVILYKTILLVTKKERIALLGTFIFGFSFTFWRNVENIEVYTFDLIWIAIYIYYATKSIVEEKPNTAYIAGLFLGISLWNHVQGILLIPSYILLLFFVFKTDYKKIALGFLIVLGFFAGLYIYPLVNNEPFKRVLASTKSSWVEDSITKGIIEYGKDFLKSIAYIIYNFWFMSIFVIFLPFKKIFEEKHILFYLLAGLPVFGFATIYAVSDNYVFFLNFNLVWVLLITIGLNRWLKNKRRLPSIIVTVLILLTPCYYAISKNVFAKTEQGKKFAEFKGYKGGLDYYMVPWQRNNIGIVDFVKEGKEAPEYIEWMEDAAREYIELKKK